MTLDQQLERVLDTFSGLLREEVARQVRVVSDELAALARAEAAAHVEAVAHAESTVLAQAEARAESVARAEAEARAEAVAHAESAARAEALAQVEDVFRAEAASRDRDAAARLVEGIRALDAARSLIDILDTLVKSAGQEASRVCVFLVRTGNFRSWRLTGFGPALDTGDPLDIEAAEAGVIEHAARTATVAIVEGDSDAAAPAFAQLPSGRRGLAVPLALCGQVVAVLYADELEPEMSNPEPGTLNLDPLEVLSRHAARCLESLTVIKATRSLTVAS